MAARATPLIAETNELVAILHTIVKNAKAKSKNSPK